MTCVTCVRPPGASPSEEGRAASGDGDLCVVTVGILRHQDGSEGPPGQVLVAFGDPNIRKPLFISFACRAQRLGPVSAHFSEHLPGVPRLVAEPGVASSGRFLPRELLRAPCRGPLAEVADSSD